MGQYNCFRLRPNCKLIREPLTNPLALNFQRASRREMGWGLNFWARTCVYLCVGVTPLYKISLRGTQKQIPYSTVRVCVVQVPLYLLLKTSWQKIAKTVGNCSSSDNHDVSPQRSAVSFLPGLTASSCCSLLAPDPVTPLKLPSWRSPPFKPACKLHTSDFLFKTFRGHSPAQPTARRLSPGVRTQHRGVCASELRPADPQQPWLSANCLHGLRLPQVRRQCDTGTIHTERWVWWKYTGRWIVCDL